MKEPIDDAVPADELNKALRDCLRKLARDDWENTFPLAGTPSIEFVRGMAKLALKRIEELEESVLTKSSE